MRLPQKEGKIDIEQTKVMVDKFLEAGFTYFDTAWSYSGSEDAIRQALVERYPREKFQLATKNAAWINCKTREEAQAILKSIPLIPCTTCNYCAKVCPMKIGISGSFTAMNMLTLYKDMTAAKHQEGWLVGGHGLKSASECIKCGKCEKVCPQHIHIRNELEKVAKTFAEN